jgi:TatD DNase family protein
MFIDTHCHLNDSKAFPDPQLEIQEAVSLDVKRMIVVGVQPLEWQSTVDLCEKHEELFCILGWHPNYTASYDAAHLIELRTLLAHPQTLGLGEIGLDYHWDYSPKETQSQALRDQLDLSAELETPVVFHAREAYGDLLDELNTRPRGKWLLHCFAGTHAVDLGCYFGVDGPISYKKADELRSIVRDLPRDRILIETDAPYMTPVPFRGKPNRPAYVRYVGQALAESVGITLEECSATTTANAIAFFGARLEIQ